MSTAFAASLPLIEKLKEELARLGKATDEIAKAEKAAEQNASVAKEAVRAAEKWTSAHDHLISNLEKQHRTSLSEQELLLRTHAADLTAQTVDQTTRHLAGLHEAAATAQVLIDKLLVAQPPLLADIATQHQKGMDRQQETLQKAAQAWADSLHQQMQNELKLLRQVIETLQKNTRQQHDELSTVANQLQVVAGRVTAFAEVMNAAQFTGRLERIEQQQQAAAKESAATAAAHTTAFGKLAAAQDQQKKDLADRLQTMQSQAAAATQQQHETLKTELTFLQNAQQEMKTELGATVQKLTAQLVAATKQQRLLQLVLMGGLVALAVVVFFKG